jgi:hypothetical protein
MNIVIYNNTMHTTELNIGDLCFNPNTKPIKYYIVHNIVSIESKLYYTVKDTRFARQQNIKKNVLIKPFKK